MAELRFKGFQTGSSVDLTVSTAGESPVSRVVSSFLAPPAIDDLPLIVTSAGQYDGDTLSINPGGLTLTAYQWQEDSGSGFADIPGETSATLDTTGRMNNQVRCVTPQGTTPPVEVYMTMMDTAHNADDQDILADVPHDEITHLFTATNGDWSTPANWHNNRVPSHGARVLIPYGTTCRYDANAPTIRLDWLRVDGTMDCAVDVDNQMLVESIVVTRSGWLTIGTGPTNRVQNGVTSRFTWSHKSYRTNNYTSTDLAFPAGDLLWSRGLNVLGRIDCWGKQIMSHCFATAPVLSGATSLTLEKDPIGWEVGQNIYISGTQINEPVSDDDPFLYEFEIREITNISGRTISWSDPLIYDHHDHQGIRTDIRPAVALMRGRNIEWISESSVPHERGQFTVMHRFGDPDIWGVQTIQMGRTNKAVPSGIVDENNDFRTHTDDGISTTVTTVPLTARSSVFGKYHWHGHHLGTKTQQEMWGKRTPRIHECYAEDTPGWLFVHHACHMSFMGNVGINYYAAGMVSEQGSETGAWANNMLAHCSQPHRTGSFKGAQNSGGRQGDSFRYGTAMPDRSREIVVTDNIMTDTIYAKEYSHREHNPVIISPLDHNREDLKFQSIGLINDTTIGNWGVQDYSRTPILNFAYNYMIACLYGFSVTKEISPQRHDKNIRLFHNTVWGAVSRGTAIEYVATYILDNWDVCMDGGPLAGFNRVPYYFETNSFQIAIVNSRAQGRTGPTDFRLTGETAGASDKEGYSITTPRYAMVANDYDGAIAYPDPGSQPQSEVIFEDDDFNNERLDFSRVPTHNFDPTVATWNGSASSGDLTNRHTNASGGKITNLGSNGEIADKPFRDWVFPVLNNEARRYSQNVGYYELSGGSDALLFRDVISDEITGRPEMYAWYVACSSTPTVGSNLGLLDDVTTTIVRPDIITTVAAGGTLVLDVVSGATGGNGTIVLDDTDVYLPNRGDLSLNTATGEVTYEPFYYLEEGEDEFYVTLRSGDNMFKMVKVYVLVGPATTEETLVGGTHITATGGAGEITVNIGQKPELYGRTVRLVQYQIPGDTKWGRVCNLWPQGDTITLTTDADGNALTSADTAIRFRYIHNHGLGESAASADVPVTVT